MAVLLIAEDDPDIRLILHRVFTRAGYTVLAEPDGAAAWERAQAQHPDVVLTDLDMPHLNGLQLCHAIRRHPALHDVPVAILSGALLPGDPRLPSAHLCEVLHKPVANDHLVATINKLVTTGRHPHTAAVVCVTAP